jgi:hypothetical protein
MTETKDSLVLQAIKEGWTPEQFEAAMHGKSKAEILGDLLWPDAATYREFGGNLEAFDAFRRAQVAGRVRIIGKRY